MKWEGNRESDNVEDRRGDSGAGGGGGLGGRHIGIGSIAIALVASYFLGVNPLTVLGIISGGGGGDAPTATQADTAPPVRATDPQTRFVRTVVASTEDVWDGIFSQAGGSYERPKLDLYRGAYPTACGRGEAAMGPFYCPGDHKVYIDLGFYDTLKNKLGAPGEFAQAYVIAHEIGHHVQNLLGTSSKMDQMRQRVSKVEYNALSVRLELQADCFAGIWANHAQDKFGLDQGDIASAMNAAARIGDDALQESAGGRVVPESFTHGTSAQRQRWFDAGLRAGAVKACDTFSARQL